MAAYLGRIEEVAYLVNERNVHPDISDVQGNSAIMYATVSLYQIEGLSFHAKYFPYLYQLSKITEIYCYAGALYHL